MASCNYIFTEAHDCGQAMPYSYSTSSADSTGKVSKSFIINTTIDKPNDQFSGAIDVLKIYDRFINIDHVYINEVLYNDPVVVVFWSDGTKTVAKCANGDIYSAETGLSICIVKKILGASKVHDLFDDWLPTEGNRVTIKDVRRKHK